MNILQFGNGQWGKNHQRILQGMGHDLKVYDIDFSNKYIMDILCMNTEAVIITASSVNHWPIALEALYHNLPVFIEKPVLLKKGQLFQLIRHIKKNMVMAGHQLTFHPDLPLNDEKVKYINSMRSGAIPRTEGALFSLMVHDIAVAFHVTGAENMEVISAEGNKHELKVSLKTSTEAIIDLYARSISSVRIRSTQIITAERQINITADNWNRMDLLQMELESFLSDVQNKRPIRQNNATDIIKIMETIFKIQDQLDENEKENK